MDDANGDAAEGTAAADEARVGDRATVKSAAGFYPETASPLREQLPMVNPRFAELREAYLLGFGVRTAAAYWGDLENFHDWCQAEEQDVHNPSSVDVQQYLDALLSVGYSPNTVARRRTTLRAFYGVLVSEGAIDANPVSAQVKAVPRRLNPEVLRKRKQDARKRISARRMRKRDYGALVRRLDVLGIAPDQQLPVLLRADGLSRGQLLRFDLADIFERAEGRLAITVMDQQVQVVVALRLPFRLPETCQG